MTIWKTYKLGEIAEIVGGGTPSTKESSYWNGAISWITPKDLSNYNSKYIGYGERNITDLGLEKSSAKILPKNTVLLTSRAPVGYLAIASNELATNQGFKSLITDEKIAHNEFVYYLLKDNVEYLKSQSSGSTFGEISGSTLKSLEFSFPDLPTQRAIAEILSSLDDKIELNNQMNKTLEEIAQAVFKQWFVDFDFPFDFAQGKPNKNGNPYKSSGGEMVESELGMIPKGWKVDIFKNHIEALRGLSYKGSGLTDFENGIPMHNLNSVYEGGGYKYKGIKFYSGDYKERHLIKPGDIIVTNTEQGHKYLLIGFPAITPTYFGDIGIFSHHIYKVTPLERSNITNQFLYYTIMQPSIREQIVGCSNGTTVNMLKIDGLQVPKFVIPKKEIIENFSKVIIEIWKAKELNFVQSESLKQTRDFLLPKLLSGEIDVSSAENIIEETEVLAMAAEPKIAYNKSK
ncbi:MAG: restriction endonuclease subunit S [Bacteroidales bacterium]|nr:restriction endonuclease subunit S [Bacteroidales bacterium]